MENDIECRICLSSDGVMITPCACTGTQAFVHSKCLHRWRNQFPLGTKNRNVCIVCKASYTVAFTKQKKKCSNSIYQMKFCLTFISFSNVLLASLLFFWCLGQARFLGNHQCDCNPVQMLPVGVNCFYLLVIAARLKYNLTIHTFVKVILIIFIGFISLT